jgi:hypothetical protein
MWGGREWRCTCGSPRCLGLIPGSFFALPIDRQIELSPFLAPWFVKAHKAEWDAFLEVTGLEDPIAHS